MAKLYFRYSAMNAGKSTALIQVAHNYEESGKSVQLYTSAVDHRFGVGTIASRLGPQRDAAVFDRNFDFAQEIAGMQDVACVLIDEAQFLTATQVRQLHKAAHTGSVPIICYGIRSDFLGNPFEGASHLLVLADSIEELKNICSACGNRKATMNVRVDAEGNRITQGAQIAIEGDVRYVQMCGRCFYESEKCSITLPALMATFVPQGWINDNAVDLDDPNRFDIAPYLLQLDWADIEHISDPDNFSFQDILCEKIQYGEDVTHGHSGPFRIDIASTRIAEWLGRLSARERLFLRAPKQIA